MLKKIILLLVYLVFSLVAFLFLGGSHQSTMPLLQELIADFGRSPIQSQPVVFAFFSLMGVWPLVIALLIAADTKGSWKIGLLFASLGMVAGAFIIAPYLILRRTKIDKKPLPIWLFSLCAVILAVLVAVILGPVFKSEVWQGFWPLLDESAFLRTMAADFLLFACCFFGYGASILRRRLKA